MPHPVFVMAHMWKPEDNSVLSPTVGPRDPEVDSGSQVCIAGAVSLAPSWCSREMYAATFLRGGGSLQGLTM